MAKYSKFTPTFLEWAVRNGYQRIADPSNVTMPVGLTINQYGWLPTAKATDYIFNLGEIKPNEQKTFYVTGQRIITASTNPIRINLQINSVYREGTDDFDPTAWRNLVCYSIHENNDAEFTALTPSKITTGNALRLIAFANTNNNGDFYFAFNILDLPYID